MNICEYKQIITIQIQRKEGKRKDLKYSHNITKQIQYKVEKWNEKYRHTITMQILGRKVE